MEKLRGYVTFGDLLAWKGIWRTRGDKALEDIVNIKKELVNKSEEILMKRKNLEFLKKFKEFDSTLSSFYYTENSSDFFQKKLKEIVDKEIGNNLVQNIGELRAKLNQMLMKEEYSLKENENFLEKCENEIRNKGTNFKMLEISLKQILIDYYTKIFDVELNVELISDTFVIYSTSMNVYVERRLHNELNKILISLCLKKGFLIRGATAYGEYYNKDSVFLGPAIDEAAMWHELGDEIGIYQTKTAELKKDNGYKWLNDNLELYEDKEDKIVTTHTIKLKPQYLDVLFIDWSEYEDDFNKIYVSQTPFLPEIASKYINSEKFLKAMKKKST